jgi:hypothetical protein
MSGSLGKPRGCKIDIKTRRIFVICQQIAMTIADLAACDGEASGQGMGEQVNKTLENPIPQMTKGQTGESTRCFVLFFWFFS